LQFGSIFLISVISGYTALMYFSEARDVYLEGLDLPRFLVESGAEVNAMNR
jgi:hypothetical protein